MKGIVQTSDTKYQKNTTVTKCESTKLKVRKERGRQGSSTDPGGAVLRLGAGVDISRMS